MNCFFHRQVVGGVYIYTSSYAAAELTGMME